MHCLGKLEFIIKLSQTIHNLRFRKHFFFKTIKNIKYIQYILYNLKSDNAFTENANNSLKAQIYLRLDLNMN